MSQCLRKMEKMVECVCGYVCGWGVYESESLASQNQKQKFFQNKSKITNQGICVM
jgi:hypothetical protein